MPSPTPRLPVLDFNGHSIFASNLLAVEPPQKSTYLEYAYFFLVSTAARFIAKASSRRSLFLALCTGFLIAPMVHAAEVPSFALTIKDHRFEPSTVTIPADTKVLLRVKNADTTAEEFESHALKREKLIPAGTEATIKVGPLKPGTYPFFGEFHEATAQGELVVE